VQAVYWSFLVQDPFGLSTTFVWFQNYAELLKSPHYLDSFRVTAIFSTLVAVSASSSRCCSRSWPTACCAGRSPTRRCSSGPTPWHPPSRGAVGVPVRALDRHRHLRAEEGGHRLELDHQRRPGDAADRDRVHLEADQLQLPLLPGGLQSIPRSLLEAAAIDGATPFRRFWTVVFPLLSPTTFYLLVINIVYAFFGTFGVVDATTQGGPAGATQILVYKVYHDGVKSADLGSSAAQSVILMLIVILLTVIQFRFVEKKVQY
jgi:sn-glycerol 3-phosphate transport system permease protein